jgi:hypothetical protein
MMATTIFSGCGMKNSLVPLLDLLNLTTMKINNNNNKIINFIIVGIIIITATTTATYACFF